MSKSWSSCFALLLLAGCRGDCEDDAHHFELQLDGAGAAFEVRGQTDDPQESVHASYFATVTNHGPDPCKVSFFVANSRPRPDWPARGALQFETVVPGARDGRTFQREVNADSGGYPGAEPWGIDLQTDAESYTIGISLRIATCPDADLEVDLQMETNVCWSLGEPRGEVLVTQLW